MPEEPERTFDVREDSEGSRNAAREHKDAFLEALVEADRIHVDRPSDLACLLQLVQLR